MKRRKPTAAEVWKAFTDDWKASRINRVREAKAAGVTFDSTVRDMDLDRVQRIINGDREALADLLELLADGMLAATPGMLRAAAAELRTTQPKRDRGRRGDHRVVLAAAVATQLMKRYGAGEEDAEELAAVMYHVSKVAVATRRNNDQRRPKRL
jgi:hypothetical protein